MAQWALYCQTVNFINIDNMCSRRFLRRVFSVVHQLYAFLTLLVFLLGINMISLSPEEMHVRVDSIFKIAENTHEKTIYSILEYPLRNIAQEMLQ